MAFSAPTGLAPVERGLGHKGLVQKPPLHRGEPGGGGSRRKPSLVQKPSVHRDEPGGAVHQPGQVLTLAHLTRRCEDAQGKRLLVCSVANPYTLRGTNATDTLR